MSRVDNIISGVKKNGTEKKKSRVETIIEGSSNGNIKTDVDDNYINSFINDAKDYFSNVDKDYKNVGYNNFSSLYDKYSSKSTDLGDRADRIRAFLNSNKNNLDEDTYNELISIINNVDKSRKSVFQYMWRSKNFYSQWETEEDYNDAVKQSELYNMPSEEIAQQMGAASAEVNTLIAERNELNRNLNAYGKGDRTKFKTSREYKDAKARRDELNKIISESQSKSAIAYTTLSGQNITWQSLYDQKKAEEDFNALYGELSANEDWEEKSQYITTNKKGTARGNSVTDLETDWYYEDVNKHVPYVTTNGFSLDTEYATITKDEEKAIFNYLYHTQGKEAAKEWHDSRKGIYKKRAEEEGFKNAVQFAEEFPALSDAVAVAASIMSGGEFLGDVLTGNIGDTNQTAAVSSAIKGTRMEQIDWEVGEWDVFDFLYGTTTSGIESAASMALFGGTGGVALGLSAAAQSTNDALNRGMSKGQAFVSGLASGIFEGVFESWSIGAFTDATKTLKRFDFQNIAKYIGKNMWNNAKEETLTEIANIAYDTLINGEFSQAETSIRQLMESGMSESDAKKQVALELGGQIAEAGASGALMGFGFGAGGAISAAYRTAKAGNALKKEGEVDNLVALSKSLGEGTESYDLANNINDKSSALAIGSLFGIAGDDILSANRGDIVKSLERKGYDTEKANRLADLMLNPESNLYANSRGFTPEAKTYNDILNNPDSTVNQRTQAYSEIIDTLEKAKKSKENKSSETTASAQTITPYSSTYVDSVAKEFETIGIPAEQARILAEKQLSAPTATNSSPSAKNLVESKFEVSDDGKTTNIKTGEVINIKNIESISKSGEANLTLDDGTVVKASDIAFSSPIEALFVENIGSIKVGKSYINTASANALYLAAMNAWKNNPNMTADEAMSLIKGFAESYIYGAYSLDMSKLTTRNEDGSATLFAGELSQSQRKFAYDLGVQDGVSKAEADQKVIDELVKKAKPKATNKSIGKVIFEKGADVDESALTKTQKANLDGIKFLAEVSSIEFHVFKSDKKNSFKYTMPDGTVTTANGWFVAGSNQIWVDINAGNAGEGTMIRTAAHEISHYIKEWSPQKWKTMADLLMAEFAKNGVDTESMLNRQINKIKRRYRANKEAMPSPTELLDLAYEELVCDALSDMLTDGSIVNFIAEVKAKDASLGKRILNAIKSLLKKWGLVIDEYKGRNLDTAEAQALSKLEDTFKKLQDMYRDAFMDANEAVAALGARNLADFPVDNITTTNIVASAEETILPSERDNLVENGNNAEYNNWESYELTSEFVKNVPYGERHAFLRSLANKTNGMKRGEHRNIVIITSGHVYFYEATGYMNGSIAKRSGITKKANAEIKAWSDYYGSIDTITTTPYEMAEGYEGGRRRNDWDYDASQNSHSKRQNDGMVEPSSESNPIGDTGEGNGDFGTDEELIVGSIVYNDNGEAFKVNEDGTIETIPSENPTTGNAEYVRSDNRKTFNQIKNSDRDTNYLEAVNKGDMKTAQRLVNESAEMAMPKSKARNADGSLMVTYHGTESSDFYVFDKARQGQTDSSVFGRGYYFSNNTEYANMFGATKKFYVNITNPFVISKISAPAAEIANKLKAHGVKVNIDYSGLEAHEFAKKFGNQKFSDTLQSLGYDGVIVQNGFECIVYDQNQMKSADAVTYDDNGNVIPLAERFDYGSNDVRYSERENLEEYTETQYDNFGWASYNNVITATERSILFSRYADFKHNKNQYPVTRWDEAVIHSTECPDVIMYIKGSIDNPQITQIVRIVTNESWAISYIKEEILKNESERDIQPFKIVEDYFGYGILNVSKARNYASYRQYRIGFERSDSKEGYTLSRKQQNRAGSFAEGEGTSAEYGEVKYSDREHISSNDEHFEFTHRDEQFSYETLTDKPDMFVTDVGGNIPRNRADVVALAKKNAASVGRANKDGSVSVYVDDVGAEVVLATKGLRHGLRRTRNSQNDANYIVTLKAGEIIKNSIKINEMLPAKDNATGSYLMIGVATNTNGDIYIVRFVVNQFNNELASMDVLYAINAKKEELAATKSPRFTAKPLSVTSSTISIADLLDLVNKFFPDVLPESVLKHYKYDERPRGDLAENILFSERDQDVSSRNILANSLESVAQNDIEKNKLAEYKKKISQINSDEQRLAEIQKLLFTKSGVDSAKRKQLQLEAKKIANRISTYDRQLLNLEATTALKNVLNREKERARKKQKQMDAEYLKEYKEKVAKNQRELLDKWHISRKKAAEGRNKTALRHKIQKVVSELNQLLLRGTKDKHVMIGLQKAVAEALDAVNMDTVGADERVAKYDALIAKATDPDVIASLVETRNRIQTQGHKMSDKLAKLKNAYNDIKNSDDPLIANSYDEVISSRLEYISEKVGNTPLRDMTVAQLEDVYDMYKMVLTIIRNSNKAFKAAKNESIANLGHKVMMEVEKVGGKTKLRTQGTDAIEKFNWNNLKPIYAFERIGSDTFTELYNNVRAGEDAWAKDVAEAKEFRLKQSEKHNFSSWDFKKRYKFTSASGMDFELSLGQIMSMYAYSKREQAAEHLRRGGIVFDETTEITIKNKLGVPLKFNPTEATAYNISEETLTDIVSKLTTEQRAFVDEMQAYLSDVMGEKGNEVSLEMYGVKLFKEKFYFPLKSATQFMAKAKEQQNGQVKIKNSGFSKETVQRASNPVVLTPFMDVWANHVNEMSMYHAFVLPMEDFYRVFNYSTATSDTTATTSVEMFIQNAYGKGAVDYIDQLLKDLNGGTISDPRETFSKSLMSKFKKASTMASLSVLVQQPTAMVRAMAFIDPKYFGVASIGRGVASAAVPGKHKELWTEVKKYAPVAIIKEMGRFDANVGRSVQEFINAEEYEGIDKIKGLVIDSEYRDDVISRLPALADEIAWVAIWEAVKRETVAKHKNLRPNSEEFLKTVGERFTEVITKTQVYDSVLSRSANMRSKSALMNMWTSFMAEPTTVINMLEDAIVQGKRGNKRYAARVIGAVYGSIIFNAALVSLVYAARDDDEDETFIEKYLSRLTVELLEGINPATYIPFVKDVWSIAQGFDIEQTDMSLVSDLMNTLQQSIKVLYEDTEDMDEEEFAEHQKNVADALWSLADNIGSLVGIPVKNVRRDINGLINLVETLKKDAGGRETTASSLFDEILEDVKSSIPVAGWLPNKTKGDKLYSAIINGDSTYVERMKNSYKDDKAYESAVRKALRENDPRVREAAQARIDGDIAEYTRIVKEIKAEGNFVQDTIVAAVNAEINALTKDESTHSADGNKNSSIYKMEDCFVALDSGDEATAYIVKEDIIKTDVSNGKEREEAEDSFNSRFVSLCRERYEEGSLSDYKAQRMLVKYGGLSEDGAASKVQYWAFKEKYPKYDLSEEAVEKYYNEVASSGITVDVYYNYSKQRSKCKGIDADGDGKTDSGSVKKEILRVIDSLPLTYSQKDVLYYLNGWSSSTIYEAPWRK